MSDKNSIIKSETVNIIIASDLNHLINTHFNVNNYSVVNDLGEDFYSENNIYCKYEVTDVLYWRQKDLHNKCIEKFKSGYKYSNTTDTLLKQLCIDCVIDAGTYFIRIY